MPRYLTKSRFTLAVECPTKLFFVGKDKEYKNIKRDDTFLQMLADGGFQVGALAKLLYPNGHEIKTKNHYQALAETAEWLKQEEVVLFEPAVYYKNLFARIDILVKRGNFLEIIEVKAKSYDGDSPQIEGARGQIKSSMLPYLHDVAFQTHVLRNAYPGMTVTSYLMMPDKSRAATVNGLNQMFKVVRKENSTEIVVDPNVTKDSMGENVLALVNADVWVKQILDAPINYPGGAGLLSDVADAWSEIYKGGQMIPPIIGSHCSACEFRADHGDDLKSGFHECWKLANNWTDKDFTGGTVLDLWNFRGKEKAIQQGIVKLRQLTQEDIKYKEEKEGLSRTQRQWMQIDGLPEEYKAKGFYFDSPWVAVEMSRWNYPYHFIDFETSSVAIPFNKGLRPYEPVAFQFSHHVMERSGEVRHQTQFLRAEPGVFPNYDFVRALKGALEGDSGSVFMWSHHENTILTRIAEQLGRDENPPPDADELVRFIRTLIRGGDRAMVDLCTLAEKGIFYPSTKGSSSIKKVLPAALNASAFLKQKYGQPIYGSPNGVKSLNYKDYAWWQAGPDGKVIEPYEQLKSYVEEMLGEHAEEALDADRFEIAEGGAAATAYARLQFEAIDSAERERIERALLRYCELDTLAMAMIVEAWKAEF